jgi:starch synthase
MITDAELSRIRVLFTIHNLAYQGLFPASDAGRVGIGPNLFHPAALEFYTSLNFMKGGLLFADYLSTVSPRYAREIQTKDFGCGLEGVLTQRSTQLSGILNGIDYNVWNPETDEHIAPNYSRDQMQGKAACKAALQQELGLHPQPDTPLIAIISRLDSQKGFDILEQALPDLLVRNMQFAVLGTGAPEYHRMLQKAAAAHPGMVAARLTFDGPLSHRIEAGADIFLMPSRYEPCGLNQMYSLRYGTVPVVRETGGLADTVTDSTPETVNSGAGTGFVFKPYDSDALTETVFRALDAYGKKAYWFQIVKNGMSRDLSWKASSKQYEELYQRMLAGTK